MMTTLPHMLLILTETRREGHYSTGDILFTSESNSVTARFTSDLSITKSGFTLDVQSISCADRPQYLQLDDSNQADVYTSSVAYPEYTDGNPNYSGNNDVCDEQELQLAAGDEQQGALVTETESDGNYPNHACQNWNIFADESQVYLLFQIN